MARRVHPLSPADEALPPLLSAEGVARLFQLALAPVVMVSSCAILLTGLLQRYGAADDRVRLLARERLDLLRTAGGDPATAASRAHSLTAERLQQSAHQIPELIERYRTLRQAVTAVYGAILLYALTVVASALAFVAPGVTPRPA